MLPWGNFPKRHRRCFIAQNGRCPYCGRQIPLIGAAKGANNLTPRTSDSPSADHVDPRWLGGTLKIGNKVVAHALCNKIKGPREPYPCEVLFAEITGELVVAMLPLTAVSTYLEQQANQPG